MPPKPKGKEKQPTGPAFPLPSPQPPQPIVPLRPESLSTFLAAGPGMLLRGQATVHVTPGAVADGQLKGPAEVRHGMEVSFHHCVPELEAMLALSNDTSVPRGMDTVFAFDGSQRLVAAACGASHAVVATHRVVVAAGSNEFGQLGVSRRAGPHRAPPTVDPGWHSWRCVEVPRLPAATRPPNALDPGPKILSVAAGSAHTVMCLLRTCDEAYFALDDPSRFHPFTEVVGCGSSESGALGDTRGVRVVDQPVRIDALRYEGVDAVWAGRSCTFARGRRGLFMLGRLGASAPAQCDLVLPASEGRVSSVAVSDSAAFVTTECSVLQMCGPRRVTDLTARVAAAVGAAAVKPKAVSAGAQHVVVLCHDGRVVGWGDNSFGQLGPKAHGALRVETPLDLTPPVPPPAPRPADASSSDNAALLQHGTPRHDKGSVRASIVSRVTAATVTSAPSEPAVSGSTESDVPPSDIATASAATTVTAAACGPYFTVLRSATENTAYGQGAPLSAVVSSLQPV